MLHGGIFVVTKADQGRLVSLFGLVLLFHGRRFCSYTCLYWLDTNVGGICFNICDKVLSDID